MQITACLYTVEISTAGSPTGHKKVSTLFPRSGDVIHPQLRFEGLGKRLEGCVLYTYHFGPVLYVSGPMQKAGGAVGWGVIRFPISHTGITRATRKPLWIHSGQSVCTQAS